MNKFFPLFLFSFFIFYFSFCNFVCAGGQNIWTAGGVALSTAVNRQDYPQIISDGALGAITCWQDSRTGVWDIYAQAIDTEGTVKWSLGGVAVSNASGAQEKPVIVSDDAGGAIICWWDKRDGTYYNIYSQRIDSSGNAQWTPDGIAISTFTNITTDVTFDKYRIGIVKDGIGGAIICWVDERNGSEDIYAQRIKGDGTPEWTENGIPVCSDSNFQNYPAIVSDNNNGAIICWHDNRDADGYWDIYSKRINSSGATVWGEKQVFSNTNGDKPPDYTPDVEMTEDGAGGALLCWQERDSTDLYDIYAQRLDGTDGSDLWGAGGSTVCNAGLHQMEPVIVKGEAAGSAIIAWRNFETEDLPIGDIYCERFGADGLPVWNPGNNLGIAVCNQTGTQENIKIIPEETGGAMITWQDNDDIYAQKYDIDGNLPWGEEYSGTLISSGPATGEQKFPQITDDGLSGAIICWQDERTTVSDIYVQRTGDPDSIAPESITTLSALTGDNPDEIKLAWIAPHEDATAGGKAGYYILKYSTEPPPGAARSAWWNASASYEQSWSPLSPGEEEQKSIYLLSSTSYYFLLRAVDDTNNKSVIEPPANAANAVSAADDEAPEKNSDLSAETGATEGKIDLTWTAPGDNGTMQSIIRGNYYIQHSTDYSILWSTGDAKIQIPIEDTDFGKSESLSLTGLIAGATYYFRIWTEDEVPNVSLLSDGTTAMAQVDITAPGTVSALVSYQVSGSSISIKLNWSAPGDDGYVNYGSTTGFSAIFKIQYSTVAAFSPSAAEAQVAISTSSVFPGDPQEKTITGLADDTFYYFALWTYDESGNPSEYSNIPSTKTLDLNPPNKITTLTGTRGYYEGEIDLVWTAPGDNGTRGALPPGSEYKIQKSTWAGVGWSTSSAAITISTTGVNPGTVILYTVTGLTPDATYYFHIWACDEVPNWSELSNGATVAAPPDLVAPGKVTTLTSFQVQGSSLSIKLSWSAPGDDDYINYGLMTGFSAEFKIQHSTFPEVLWSTSSAQVSITTGNVNPGDLQTRIITGLNDETTYYFHLWTCDEVPNWSELSNRTTVWAWADTIAPGKVTTLTSFQVQGSSSSIELSWSAPGDDNYINEGSTTGFSAEFKIQRSTFSEVLWSTSSAQVSITTGNVKPGDLQTRIITGLADDTTYYFRLWTRDERYNWSDYSNETSTKTPDVVSPLAVGNLAASMLGEPEKISLVWTAPGDNGMSEVLPGGSSFRIDYSTYQSKPWVSTVYEIEIPTSAVAPGDPCSKIVAGLVLQATYYFSVWTIDEAGNVSTNSNVADARTLDISSPAVNINFPLENESYGFMDVISGSSTDAYTGVKKVLLTISGLSNYWDGSCWLALSTSVLTSGTTNWSYGFNSSNWVSGSTYTLTAAAYDADDNYFSSQIQFYFDSLPPETITALSALPDSSYDGRVHLSWSAPADLPLSNSVKEYSIHRATFNFIDLGGDTTLWWNSSQEINNSISPASPGVAENFTISGLTAGVTYYFTVKSIDSVEFYFSTSAVSNQAKVVAPYGIYIPTSFNVSGVPSPILTGVPADVTVECRNPGGIAVNYTDWINFSSTDTAAELPGNYKFTAADQGTHTFSGEIIFGTEGIFSLVVSTGDATGKQSGIDVRTHQYEQITSTGKNVEILGDSRINIIFPAGAVKDTMALKIKISTAGENHAGGDNLHINSALNSGKAVYGIQLEEGTNPAATASGKSLTVKKTSLSSSENFSNGVKLTLIYFDFDGDGLEDKSGSDETNLGIFYWDGFNWRYLGGEVNTSSDTISANIYNLGLFGVFPLKSNQSFSLSDYLPKRKIFTPNNDGVNDYIEFVGLNKPFKITIYSLAGKIIREISDEPRWYGRSSTGKIAESGIYIYRVEKDGVTKNGAVVIAK
ncbi:MAG: gliding motility-associated C-terminal domain-containing protein [bacterium]